MKPIIPSTTKRGYKIGHITEQILFQRYQSRLTDDEKKQQAEYVKKHHTERIDLVDAIELCANADHQVLADVLKKRFHISGQIIVRSSDDYLGHEMLKRVIARLNNRLVSLYGTVIN